LSLLQAPAPWPNTQAYCAQFMVMGATCCSDSNRSQRLKEAADGEIGLAAVSGDHVQAPSALTGATHGPDGIKGRSKNPGRQGRAVPENACRTAPVQRSKVELPQRSPAPSAEIVQAQGHDEDRFISQVGELPTFGKPSKSKHDSSDLESDESLTSQVSSFNSEFLFSSMRTQVPQAKCIIKSFVKEMVKGKDVNVLAPSGDVKLCSISLNRNLDKLTIKMGSASRKIPLKTVDEIHAGANASSINHFLDELCATVVLTSGDAISFRLADMDARDTFVLCLSTFVNKQK